MHEKTLLYGALAATAIGAIFAVRSARSSGSPAMVITPVTIVEAAGPIEGDAPIRLTASDGSGITLVALEAHAVVDDPLALTELHLVFENPEDRTREGTFRITLPQGASLSRFAMKVGETWQEGEVVEKQAARRAYEDFLHRRQDPALMEQAGGNEFSARVFPIPARGKKEIVLTYAEVLSASAPYVLPLRGLPTLGALDIDVQTANRVSYGVRRERFTPGADFVLPAKDVTRTEGVRSGELVVSRIVPFASSRPDPIASAVVLVDTSASRALGLAEQGRLLAAVLGKLGTATVSVAAFDQETEPLYEGPASAFGEKELQRLAARGALGGSDLEGAFEWAAAEAKRSAAKRVVLLTDGVATVGETSTVRLRMMVEALRAAGVERMDAIAVGGIRDDGLLRALVRGVLDKQGVVLDGKLDPTTIARRLSEATSSGERVTVPHASWSWPRTLDGLQAGDELVVFAKMEARAPFSITTGTSTTTPVVHQVDRPLVERAVAQAEIQSILETPSKNVAQDKEQIVALSTKHRVLSPHTALLVLETDQDYARFAIDRKAKVDILAVRAGRVAVLHSDRGRPDVTAKAEPKKAEEPSPDDIVGTHARPGGTPELQTLAPALAAADPAAAAPAPAAAPADWQLAITAGPPAARVELEPPPPPPGALLPPQIGGGAGEGAASRERQGPIPKVTVGSTTATLPISDANRVVAGLRSRFMRCYQQGLAQDPGLTGNLVLEVTVNKNGGVSKVTHTGSGLTAAVSVCVVRVMKSVELSPPGGDSQLRVPLTFAVQDPSREPPQASATPPKPPASKPYDGPFKTVMELIAKGDKDGALAEARRWQATASGDVMALVGLGEAFEANGNPRGAARAYGSILELFASRADSRRFAGERLERLKARPALELAADTFAKAAEQRSDHPASHRLLAFALLKAGQYEKAFHAIAQGAKRTYPSGRFAGVNRILHEDVGLIAAAWTKAEPKRGEEIARLRTEAEGTDENNPSVRFVLVWETDANDVDFHIYDGKGGHAYYANRQLPSGGELYADVTTGYGPECFTIRGARAARAYPYTLQAHYYSRGPMGYGMGKLQIIDHDGKGGLTFEERPFVVMVDRAFVDLGTVERPKP